MSCKKTLVMIRRLALTFGKGKITLQSLVMAVLTLKTTRRLIPRAAKFKPADLRPPLPYTKLLEDDPRQPWPDEIFPDSDDTPLFLRDDSDSPVSEKKKKPRLPGTLFEFVQNLWIKTSNSLWLRPSVFASREELETATQRACRRLCREFPHQAESVVHLLQLLDRRLRKQLASPGAPLDPVVILTLDAEDVIPILKAAAREYGITYIQVDPDTTTPSEYTSAAGEVCHLAGIFVENSMSTGSAAYFLVSGHVNHKDKSESFLLEDPSDFQKTQARGLPVLVLALPLEPGECEGKSLEEILFLSRQYYRREMERVYITNLPAFLWRIPTHSNTVFFLPPGARALKSAAFAAIESELEAARSEGREILLPDKEEFARLLLFSLSRASVERLKDAAKARVQQILRIGRSCPDPLRVALDPEAARALHKIAPNSDFEARFRERMLSGRFVSCQMKAKGGQVIIHSLVDRVAAAAGLEGAMIERPNLSLGDVCGCEPAKRQLASFMKALQDPRSYDQMEAKAKNCILLYGPPGNGKTLLAKAVAAETNCAFIYVSASILQGQKYAGEGVQYVERLFAIAKASAPCVLILDEIDALGARNNNEDSSATAIDQRATFTAVLTGLESLLKIPGILVIGATNLPESLDPALTRDGRFGTKIHVDLPTAEARRALITRHLSARVCPTLPQILDSLVYQSSGLPCASIVRLVNEAKLLAIERESRAVEARDLQEAVETLRDGPKTKPLSEEARRRAAIHEAGHAIVAHVLLPHKPLQRISLRPRGDYLGVTELRDPNENEYPLHTASDIEAEIVLLLAGPAATKLRFGDLDTGCFSDLQEAASLVRFYVRFLDAHSGFKSLFTQESDSSATSDELCGRLDKFMTECREKALGILRERESLLTRLAEELERKEVLYEKEIQSLLAPLS